jgi:glycine/D-amino acid oxidase-like deaminating enzyme
MYLEGLARAVEQRGGRIFEGTRVMEASGGEGGVVTEGGARVRCDHVVLATNSPINLNLAVHSRQSPYRSYVVGLVIPRDLYRLAEYWSTEEPYHYIRVEDWDDQNYLLIVGESGLRGAAGGNTARAAGQGRAFKRARRQTRFPLRPPLDDHRPRAAGGEDHFTGVQPSTDPYVALENYARRRWPACREVALRWNGQVSHVPCLHSPRLCHFLEVLPPPGGS